MECIAEWVETGPILKAMRELGIEYGQGHALSHPVSLEQMLQAARARLRGTLPDGTVLAQSAAASAPAPTLLPAPTGAATATRSAAQIAAQTTTQTDQAELHP